MPKNQTRRKFMQTTAVAGVGYWAVGSTAPVFSQSPNEQIQFACVGVGGKGDSDSKDASNHGQVVAICDVDSRTLDRRALAPKFKDAKKYFDFRTMLDDMADTVDAVTVSTPDHNHAPAGLMAMRMGKHCFCQKPMTRTIYEARLMGEVAKEKGVQTQMGNQGTSTNGLREAAAIVKSGALGKVGEVHVWTNRPIWPQGEVDISNPPPVPDYLHWEQWLGPAKFTPYHPAYHPFKWRGFWAFGTGALGDMACHTVNLPFQALNLRDPISVEAKTTGHNKITYPGSSVITFEFPELDGRPPVTMKWYDGGQKPEQELLDGLKPSNSGMLMIGEKGKLYSVDDYGQHWQLLGIDKPKDVEYPRSPGHFTEFARAIQTGEPAMSNFPDYAGPLTETILLGNLAVWSGEKVEWDPKALKSTNQPELESFVKPTYRDGYTLDA